MAQFREGGSAREENREHRPQDATGVLSLWILFREALSPMWRSAVHLLAEVILQAHLFDQSELGFEEVDVLLFVFQENLEEIG